MQWSRWRGLCEQGVPGAGSRRAWRGTQNRPCTSHAVCESDVASPGAGLLHLLSLSGRVSRGSVPLQTRLRWTTARKASDLLCTGAVCAARPERTSAPSRPHFISYYSVLSFHKMLPQELHPHWPLEPRPLWEPRTPTTQASPVCVHDLGTAPWEGSPRTEPAQVTGGRGSCQSVRGASFRA